MNCGIPIDKILLPEEILHTDYPLLSGGAYIED